MSTSRTYTWALALLIGAAAVVVGLYTIQRPLQDLQVHIPGRQATGERYCYKGIRTHDDERPSATCFTVLDGVFTSVDDAADAAHEEDNKGAETGEDDVRAGYVLPGLWDGHGHLFQYGEFLHSVDLFGTKTFEEVRERLREYLARHPGAGGKDEWVRGVGWDQMALGRMPTADDLKGNGLDGLHIMFDRVDVHCTWVSYPILSLLPASIPDVPGGEVIRDPGMGVFCDNAMDMVNAVFPPHSKERKAQFVRAAMAKLNEVGLVGMHDAGATPGTLELYGEMAGREGWSVRVYAMGECVERNALCIGDMEKVRVEREDGMFTVRSIKLFADGALGSWGSAMIEPYSDKPETSGSLLINRTALIDVTKAWSAAGYQVNIHAIGDLANRHAVDAIEASLQSLCPDNTEGDLAACQARHRFRIEHAQIIHPDDQARMRRMGVLPSIQPTHATSDMKYAEERLGAERTAREAYRMGSVWDLRPVLGSDFPVEPPNPFEGVYAAVTRRSPHTGLGKDGSGEGWYAEEALGLGQGLRGFTTSVAFGGFAEGKAGVIKEGAWADWIVLDEDVMRVDVEDLRHLRVRETWVGGKLVYRRED